MVRKRSEQNDAPPAEKGTPEYAIKTRAGKMFIRACCGPEAEKVQVNMIPGSQPPRFVKGGYTAVDDNGRTIENLPEFLANGKGLPRYLVTKKNVTVGRDWVHAVMCTNNA